MERPVLEEVQIIRPDNSVKFQKSKIPRLVISTFNSLISLHFDKSKRMAEVLVSDVVGDLVQLGFNRADIIHRFLNIEHVFRLAGWTVLKDNKNKPTKLIFRPRQRF